MIAGRDHVDAGVKEVRGGARRNAGTARAVFAVGDHQIAQQLLTPEGQQRRHGAASRLADDVTDEQDAHHA